MAINLVDPKYVSLRGVTEEIRMERNREFSLKKEKRMTIERKINIRKIVTKEIILDKERERFFKEEIRDGPKVEKMHKGADSSYSTIKKIGEDDYLGFVLERHLLVYFKNIVEIKTAGKYIRKPVDWIYDIENKNIKIKQISSRFNIYIEDDAFVRELAWWSIGCNDVPDVFMLSAWSDIQKPIPLHVFVIGKHEIVGRQEFCKRSAMHIYNNRVALARYSRFLIGQDGLENMHRNFEKRLKEIGEYNQRKGFTKQ
jgi:hypothetical protein